MGVEIAAGVCPVGQIVADVVSGVGDAKDDNVIWEEVHAGDDVATHGDNRRGRRGRPLRCAAVVWREVRISHQLLRSAHGRIKSARSTRPPSSSPSVPGNGLPQSHTCGAIRTRDRSARWTGPLSCRQVTNRVSVGRVRRRDPNRVLPVRGRPPCRRARVVRPCPTGLGARCLSQCRADAARRLHHQVG